MGGKKFLMAEKMEFLNVNVAPFVHAKTLKNYKYPPIRT